MYVYVYVFMCKAEEIESQPQQRPHQDKQERKADLNSPAAIRHMGAPFLSTGRLPLN